MCTSIHMFMLFVYVYKYTYVSVVCLCFCVFCSSSRSRRHTRCCRTARRERCTTGGVRRPSRRGAAGVAVAAAAALRRPWTSLTCSSGAVGGCTGRDEVREDRHQCRHSWIHLRFPEFIVLSIICVLHLSLIYQSCCYLFLHCIITVGICLNSFY